jgi:hypothetical protein
MRALLRASSSYCARERSRWRLICDVLTLQLKLLAVNVHNLILIPATLAAALLDLTFRSGSRGGRFYRALEWGRRAEEAIGLYSALCANRDGAERDAEQEHTLKK